MRAGKRFTALAGAATLLWVATAFAWESEALVEVRVNEHEYDRVALWNHGCTLNVKLSFTAPQAGYDGSVAERNYHRFKARANFDGGKQAVSNAFGNPAAGRRVYVYGVDTSSEGCWAKQSPKFTGIDVEGCRGRTCKPRPFQN